MNYEHILYERKKNAGIITLNRPEVLNAMNGLMWENLSHALSCAKSDKDIKVLIFTGTGRAFSTGADLKQSGKRTKDQYRAYLEKLQKITREILNFEKPTIAAINGYALGSGYELALACDMRITADSAIIGSPEAKVTSSLTGGAFILLQDLIGYGKACELLFTAENINGHEAKEIGLVNRVVKLEKLMDETLDLAEKISGNSEISLRMIKQGLIKAREHTSFEEIMKFEVDACIACVSSKEREQSLSDFETRRR